MPWLPKGKHMKKSAIVLCAAIAAVLSGCGLKLRGWEDNPIKPNSAYTAILLKGSSSSTLYRHLYGKLSALGVPMVDKPGKNVAEVNVMGPTCRTSTVAVNSFGAETEYMTVCTTHYTIGLFGQDTKPRKRTIRIKREYLNKNEEVIASSNESGTLAEQMQIHAAEEIYIQFLRYDRWLPRE